MLFDAFAILTFFCMTSIFWPVREKTFLGLFAKPTPPTIYKLGTSLLGNKIVSSKSSYSQ